MGMNNYNSNDEEKFSNLIALLKELPEEKAPDDFEFRLMTKIQNGNFNTSADGKSSVFPYWIFAPASAIIISAAIFIFVVDVFKLDENQPIFPEPTLRTEAVSESNAMQPKEFLSKQTISEKKEVPVKVIVEPNDVVVTREFDAKNLNAVNSVNLDKAIITGQPKPNTKKNPGILVGRSESPYFEFNGFYSGMERINSADEDSAKSRKNDIK